MSLAIARRSGARSLPPSSRISSGPAHSTVNLVPLPTRTELEPWMLRYIQDKGHEDGVQVLDEYAWDFRVLGGLLERVRRMARAYLYLEKRGYAAEGRVLVRSALEHAVTAQWAFLIPDGLLRLEVGLHRARLDYAKRSRDPADAEWDDILRHVEFQIPRDERGNPERGLPKFNGFDGVISELDHTGYLRRAYATLSRVSHVTDQAVTDYFLQNDDNDVAIASAPSDLHELDVYHTLATSCCLAAWLLARLEGDTRGIEIATSQGLLWRLDTNLPPDRRRFTDEDI